MIRRPAPVELSTDARFGRRVRRLAATALITLGLIWALAVSTLDVPPVVAASLAAGWISMPVLLVASLRRPGLRYALIVPASLVGIPLLVICAAWLPPAPLVAVGWLLITAGIALGAAMGTWFWYRLVPVPAALDDPFAPGRVALIRVHIGLIVAGLMLAATGP